MGEAPYETSTLRRFLAVFSLQLAQIEVRAHA
jgi:hypothetical protein